MAGCDSYCNRGRLFVGKELGKNMANMIRMVRFSVGLGEMHSTYLLLESMKRESGLDDPFLESMRIRLKLKLMQEEEGLLSIAYEKLAEKPPKKYGMEGLGFSNSQDIPNPPNTPIPTGDFNEDFMAKLNASLEAKKGKGNEDGEQIDACR